ncbi:unnamed protein product [Vitrella brassicaformis CCMP3155]|uniref:Uncharacterized protein n=1 Tax=Vitrella brassicaformis (strain CCMP3155) TaxID=1169540 RepID=A0A0G4GY63_VITBC|nr:unnamed protein product [Vitrella brassicaformis CCMP3155]|eukprot:CEM36022.1 unnamed protein product [Vitrella brassicaformis CCMP3155]
MSICELTSPQGQASRATRASHHHPQALVKPHCCTPAMQCIDTRKQTDRCVIRRPRAPYTKDRPVGWLDVYADGHGGYAVKIDGELRPVRREDAAAVMLYRDHGSSAGSHGPHTGAAAAKVTGADGHNASNVFIRSPSGTFYQVLEKGSGPKPTPDQTTVHDYIEWCYDSEGNRTKIVDRRGEYVCVATLPQWVQEMLTDMRVNEVRNVAVRSGSSRCGGVGHFAEMKLVATR